MIRQIDISNVATYPKKGIKIENLETINYFFGYNGCGKTTISRIINDTSKYEKCSIIWENNTKIDTFVYNSDFVKKNIHEKMKGIFTIGENNIDVQRELDKISSSISDLEINSKNHKEEINKYKTKMELMHDNFSNEMWKYKEDNFKKYKDLLYGFNKSKKIFLQKIIEEYKKNKSYNTNKKDFDAKYNIIFSDIAKQHSLIDLTNITETIKNIHTHEADPILSQRIVGRDDTIISQLIKEVGNSDWVHQGLKFLDKSKDKCPFCQQHIDHDLQIKLRKLFDKTYHESLSKINLIKKEYKKFQENINNFINITLDEFALLHDIPEIAKKTEAILSIKDGLVLRLDYNYRVLNKKFENPSETISYSEIESKQNSLSISPTKDLLEKLINEIKTSNSLIEEHNRLIDNKNKYRESLTKEIWALFHLENKEAIEKYISEYENLSQEVDKINNNLKSISHKIKEKNDEKYCLEKSLISVKPTIKKINDLLKEYGFTNFFLENIKGTNDYTIVRPNKEKAYDTLSEGEKSFVSFLYFYYLLEGSTNEKGINQEKIVVIDDPVSSMDFNISFIVSSIIKEIIRDTQNKNSYNKKNIKQFFLLSHNVYFFKEITHNSKGKKHTFWVIKKHNNISEISYHDHNPIKTSYNLLWDEIRNAQHNPQAHSIAIQNTCRRILEYYFTFIGNTSLGKLPNKFPPDEKIICSSLINWAHDGSHNIPDGIYADTNKNGVKMYLSIFERIFKEMGHKSHYDMMMNPQYETP